MVSQTPYQLLKSNFKIKSLTEIYNQKFKSSKTKGIDRLSGIQFGKQSKSQIRVIRNKCLKGTYKFSPYLELLSSKGRGKAPRLLAIPTVRDRMVLHALKEILFKVFPDCVPSKLANTYIHEINKFTANRKASEISFIRTDIKIFYASIDRNTLFSKLSKKIKSRRILSLIAKAIETPIVPKNYHRKERNKYSEESQGKGIPQGLSISNILASIYLNDLDNDIRNNTDVQVYYRYVDDILIFTDNNKLDEIDSIFKDKIKALNLQLNEQKTYKNTADHDLEYLGYRFELPKVTVKASSLERFLHSVAAKFSSYLHNRERMLKKFQNNTSKIKEIFLADLNEKITGAISENRRYGWVFYFNAITDLSVLYKIDKIIADFFGRLDDFNKVDPPNIKKISRAFYEAKYNPKGGYIHNYDNYDNVKKKQDLLMERGWLDPKKEYSKGKIEELYEQLKQKKLSELEKDDAILY